jgi:hypothetical protein
VVVRKHADFNEAFEMLQVSHCVCV